MAENSIIDDDSEVVVGLIAGVTIVVMDPWIVRAKGITIIVVVEDFMPPDFFKVTDGLIVESKFSENSNQQW